MEHVARRHSDLHSATCRRHVECASVGLTGDQWLDCQTADVLESGNGSELELSLEIDSTKRGFPSIYFVDYLSRKLWITRSKTLEIPWLLELKANKW